MALSIIVLITGLIANVKALGEFNLKVTEIGSNYLKGDTSKSGTIEIYNKDDFLGRGQATGDFEISFNKNITASELTLNFTGADEEHQTNLVKYEPFLKMNIVNDKHKVFVRHYFSRSRGFWRIHKINL